MFQEQEGVASSPSGCAEDLVKIQCVLHNIYKDQILEKFITQQRVTLNSLPNKM